MQDTKGQWIRFTNGTPRPIWLMLEPYAIRWQMNRGEEYIVFVAQDEEMPEICYSEDTIAVWVSRVLVYQGKELLLNYPPYDFPPPFGTAE